MAERTVRSVNKSQQMTKMSMDVYGKRAVNFPAGRFPTDAAVGKIMGAPVLPAVPPESVWYCVGLSTFYNKVVPNIYILQYCILGTSAISNGCIGDKIMPSRRLCVSTWCEPCSERAPPKNGVAGGKTGTKLGKATGASRFRWQRCRKQNQSFVDASLIYWYHRDRGQQWRPITPGDKTGVLLKRLSWASAIFLFRCDYPKWIDKSYAGTLSQQVYSASLAILRLVSVLQQRYISVCCEEALSKLLFIENTVGATFQN